MEQDVIDDVIIKLEEMLLVLTVTKGNVHNLLGMKIWYLKNRSISTNMMEYITEAVQEFGEDVSHVVTSPTTRWMSTVEKVRESHIDRLNTFHSVVMKLLYILQRGRPDCAKDISFLCTSMNHPDVEDWNNLNRLL